jgi:hypothetical protein
MEGSNITPQAQFNSAFVFLNRLEYLFSECAESRYNIDAFKWVESLACLFAELCNYMKVDDKDGRLVELWDLKDGLKCNVSKRGMNSVYYKRLFSFELWLRKVKNDAGLEMPVKDDAGNVLFKGGY